MKISTRTTVLGIAAALLLTGCGSDSAAQPEPAPTVTVTAEPVVTEVEVEVTPQVCIEALENTGEVIGIMAKIQEQVPPAIDAAYNRDAAALEAVTSEVTALNEQTDALMPAAVDAIKACQASAE